jgi:hypothetical protein
MKFECEFTELNQYLFGCLLMLLLDGFLKRGFLLLLELLFLPALLFVAGGRVRAGCVRCA